MNFSFPDPQFYFSPNPATADPSIYSTQPPSFCPMNAVQSFAFSQRVARIDFNTIGNVDVTQIAKNGDVLSIQQLLYPIAFSNITQEDAAEFGSRGALHCFLILQMAVEYLIGVVNSLMSQMPPQMPPKPETPPPPPDQVMVANYEAQLSLLKKDIQSRDLIIDNLADKLADCQSEKNSLKAQLQNVKRREASRKLRPKQQNNDSFSEGEIKKDAFLKLSATPQPKMHLNGRKVRHMKQKKKSDSFSDQSSSDWI